MNKIVNSNENLETENKKPLSRRIFKGVLKLLILIFALYFVILTVTRFCFYVKAPETSVSLEKLDKKILYALDEKYPERRILSSRLPYEIDYPSLDVLSESAILIDASNGSILWEKNADEIIPPASMTKLFSMYVVFKEVEKGNISYDDIIPLVPESWACNMMPHSSLMFLGKNQRVTLDELLTGLAVSSGNDAAYALAYHLFGSMEKFVEKMNEAASSLNLTNTYFVESSGYSELNRTTAREMAEFSREYINRFPEALKYHSVRSFSYPKERNLAPEDKGKERTQDFSNGLPSHIIMEIEQSNTNPLLPVLPGCDGIKTGYIDESGYNLALTVMRNGVRFISVTMKGPGNSTREGQAGRVHDGNEIMEWAFKTFSDFRNPSFYKEYDLRVTGGKSMWVKLVPAFTPESLTVPNVLLKKNQAEVTSEGVNVRAVLPDYKKGGVDFMEECGYLEYRCGDYVLSKIPLVSVQKVEKLPKILCISEPIFAGLMKIGKQQ